MTDDPVKRLHDALEANVMPVADGSVFCAPDVREESSNQPNRAKANRALFRKYNRILYNEGLRVITSTWQGYWFKLCDDDVERKRIRANGYRGFFDDLEEECREMAPGDALQHYAYSVHASTLRNARDVHERTHDPLETHQRRAVRYGVLSTLTRQETAILFAVADGECVYCGLKDANAVTLDHVVPMSGGGDHALWNITVACLRCNCRKHILDLETWCAREGLDLTKVEARIHAIQAEVQRRIERQRPDEAHEAA